MKLQLTLCLLLLTILQFYNFLPFLFIPLMPAPVCQSSHCSAILFKVHYYKIKNVLFCFMYSWVPRIPLVGTSAGLTDKFNI